MFTLGLQFGLKGLLIIHLHLRKRQPSGALVENGSPTRAGAGTKIIPAVRVGAGEHSPILTRLVAIPKLKLKTITNRGGKRYCLSHLEI